MVVKLWCGRHMLDHARVVVLISGGLAFLFYGREDMFLVTDNS